MRYAKFSRYCAFFLMLFALLAVACDEDEPIDDEEPQELTAENLDEMDPEEVTESVVEELSDLSKFEREGLPFQFIQLTEVHAVAVAMVMNINSANPEAEENELSPEDSSLHALIWDIEDVQNVAEYARSEEVLLVTWYKKERGPSADNPYHYIDLCEMGTNGLPVINGYRIHQDTKVVEKQGRLGQDYQPI